MNDAEFRRHAHALLKDIDERWRQESGPVDLDSCACCGRHGRDHKAGCRLADLLAADAASQTCRCAFPPAHAPNCPALGPLYGEFRVDLPPAAMTDAEFRRRAHALLVALNGPLRPGSGTDLDLDEHESQEMAALLANGRPL